MAWDQIQEVQGALLLGDGTLVHHSAILETGKEAVRWLWESGSLPVWTQLNWTYWFGQRHHVHVQVSISRCPRGLQPSHRIREAHSGPEAKVPDPAGN